MLKIVNNVGGNMDSKLEQLGLPKIKIKFGGAATAHEVYEDSLEIRDKINDIILDINSLRLCKDCKSVDKPS